MVPCICDKQVSDGISGHSSRIVQHRRCSCVTVSGVATRTSPTFYVRKEKERGRKKGRKEEINKTKKESERELQKTKTIIFIAKGGRL